MVKKKQLFYFFIFFCSFTLIVCGKKNNLLEPGFVWPLGAGAGAAR